MIILNAENNVPFIQRTMSISILEGWKGVRKGSETQKVSKK